MAEEKEEQFNQEEMDYGEVLFEWDVSEYLAHQRGRLWYGITLGLSLILIIYSICTANFLFALIIIIAIFILFLRSYNPPRQLNFKIREEGVMLGNQFFPYNTIQNFYIVYKPPIVKKIFFSLKSFLPDLSIELKDINPLIIREKLLEFLREDLEKERETMDDVLEIFLKL
jgi:hypothetical protein